jgi:hypothetical protein
MTPQGLETSARWRRLASPQANRTFHQPLASDECGTTESCCALHLMIVRHPRLCISLTETSALLRLRSESRAARFTVEWSDMAF